MRAVRLANPKSIAIADTLNPWRDPSWRPGLWLGLASFYHTSSGFVQSELLMSESHGESWERVAASGTAFIRHGATGSWDSMGIYAGAPVADPKHPGRLLVYYEGVNVPHNLSPGHSRYGLAYSPAVPAGLSGVGEVATRFVAVTGAGRMWVEGDATALQGLRVVARGRTGGSMEAVRFADAPSSAGVAALPRRKAILQWRASSGHEAVGLTDLGGEVAFTFTLQQGTLFSFGFES